MRHTDYLLKSVTIDNAKPRDRAYALTDGAGRRAGVCASVGAITPQSSDEFSINVIGGRPEPM